MTEEKIIDGKGQILGKLCTQIAKELLKGTKIDLLNAEKIVITGNKTDIVEKFRTRYNLRAKANPLKGPRYSRMPDKIVRRSVKGMLPNMNTTEREAIRRLHVHISVPKELEGKETAEITEYLPREGSKFIQVAELSKLLGAKW